MAVVIITVAAFALIPLIALRIILSWVLPKATMAKIDQAVSTALKLIMQLSLVGLAGIIVYAFWAGNK